MPSRRTGSPSLPAVPENAYFLGFHLPSASSHLHKPLYHFHQYRPHLRTYTGSAHLCIFPTLSLRNQILFKIIVRNQLISKISTSPLPDPDLYLLTRHVFNLRDSKIIILTIPKKVRSRSPSFKKSLCPPPIFKI